MDILKCILKFLIINEIIFYYNEILLLDNMRTFPNSYNNLFYLRLIIIIFYLLHKIFYIKIHYLKNLRE